MTSAQTVAQLADPGLTDFNSYCRSCHGRGGEGGSAPSLAGFGVRLAQYATAQGLFDRISATMPANTPGSLSQQQYFQITVYILLQNGYVTEEAVISDGFLAGIALS